jgi:hypothetical protein
MSKYSLDLALPPPTSEGKLILLGATVGALLSWVFFRVPVSGWEIIENEAVEVILYVGAIGAVSVQTVLREGRQVIRGSMAIVLGSVAILLYWNALELFWLAPQNNYFLIGGLVPSSDADSWLSGGWRLLETGTISEGDQRRPVNAALHALRLYIAGSFQGSLMLGAVVCAAASLYAAYSLKSSLGWPGAAVFLVFSFWLIREHLPLAMTEVHGFIFGCLAFGCLWRAALTRSSLLFGLGLVLLSIGLNARSGPFFVLPALLFWGTMNLGVGKRLSLSALLVGTLAILSGFLVSTWFVWLWGSGESIQQSNFSLTLYGMAVGGKGWLQAFSDFPELFKSGFGSGHEAEIAQFLYVESLKEIISKPERFIKYYLAELWEFIHLFLKYDLGVSRVAMVLAGLWILARWRDRLAQMGILMFLGILLSAPFLMDDAGVRPFAPVYPVFAAVPALVAGIAWRALFDRHAFSPSLRQIGGSASGGFAFGVLGFLAIAILGPIMAVWAYDSPTAVEIGVCPKGSVSFQTNAYVTAYVNVVDDSSVDIRSPDIGYRDFLRTFPRSQAATKREQVTEMSAPFALVSGLNASTRSRQIIWIKGKLELVPREGVSFCVYTDNPPGYLKGQINSVRDW